MTHEFRSVLFALLLGAANLSLAADGAAFTLQGSFSVGTGDNPNVSPTVGADGMIYGVTPNNGRDGQGSLYRRGAGGQLTILHWFDYELGAPSGALTALPDGSLWGLASYSGPHRDGAVYRFDPITVTVQAMHSFRSSVDGDHPNGRVLLASDGYLYGTTSGGGGAGKAGTIFRVDPASRVLKTLHRFVNELHAVSMGPTSGLVESPDGYLYGVTQSNRLGGSPGSIYRFDLTTREMTPIHRFSRATEGANPFSELVVSADGTLFGTLPVGGSHDYGTVFALRPDGTLVVLHTFTDNAHGYFPSGGLILRRDGRLYGVTQEGGTGNGGVAYRLNRNGDGFVVLKSFRQGDARRVSWPRGELVEYAGGLWGVTDDGGVDNPDSGALYSLESPFK